MIFLYLIKYQINERFNNRLPFPLPAELIIVIIATSVSYSFHFDEEYNLKVVGLLPTGLVYYLAFLRHIIGSSCYTSYSLSKISINMHD